jgi:O-acetyl-ADP-ribose deacetylase (regulator of RNase III)
MSTWRLLTESQPAQQAAQDVLSLTILAAAFISLAIGLILHFRNRSNQMQTVCWMLYALVPVFLIFSFFPSSSLSATFKGVSMGGAIAAFFFIWRYGMKRSIEAAKVDDLQQDMLTLRDEADKLRDRLAKATGARLPAAILVSDAFLWKLKSNTKKQIGLSAGDIREVKTVDIWVNSENTNMQLARYYDPSISGIIRYLGAKKDAFGEVTEDGDTIEIELKKCLGNRRVVQPATVIATDSGELKRTHNVKKVFHVASVRGQAGSKYAAIANLQECITACLQKADEFKDLPCRSILFPLLGSGAANEPVTKTAPLLIQAAISYLQKNAASTIDTVFFLAFTDVELEECRAILEKSAKVVPVQHKR